MTSPQDLIFIPVLILDSGLTLLGAPVSERVCCIDFQMALTVNHISPKLYPTFNKFPATQRKAWLGPLMEPKLICPINLHSYSRAVTVIYSHFKIKAVEGVYLKKYYLYSSVSSLEGPEKPFRWLPEGGNLIKSTRTALRTLIKGNVTGKFNIRDICSL